MWNCPGHAAQGQTTNNMQPTTNNGLPNPHTEQPTHHTHALLVVGCVLSVQPTTDNGSPNPRTAHPPHTCIAGSRLCLVRAANYQQRVTQSAHRQPTTHMHCW